MGKKNPKAFKGARGVVAVLAAAACGLSLVACGGGIPSAEDAAMDAAQAYVDQDPQAYYALLAPGYVNYIVGPDGWFETEEDFEEEIVSVNMQELRDEFEDCVGSSNPTVDTMAVNDVRKCEDDATLEDVKDELVNNFNYEDEGIQDAAEVEIYYQVVGNGSTDALYQTFGCVKIDGSWYIHQPGFDAL